jgi:hypothetical protein
MRKITILVLALFYGSIIQLNAAEIFTYDTGKIVHVIDGNTKEWNVEKFEKDKDTEISYAIDQDDKNIYLAVKVPNQRIQMKMMMQGMNLYFDKKGKKKEGTGIEFPIKRERESGGGGFGGGRGNRGETGERPDMKEQREKLAAGMIFLKIFGFDGQEDKTQLITQPDGINVSFDWDDANLLSIEYQVPINFIGKVADLKGKTLSIGFKLNGAEQSGGPTVVRTEIVGVPAGSGRGAASSGGGRGAGSGRSFDQSNNESRNELMKEQSFWTKINFNF